MINVVMLDSTPLWLLCLKRGARNPNPDRDRCISWLAAIKASGKVVVIPEIIDYETRRKLIHFKLRTGAKSVERLDALIAVNEYLPLTTAMMRKASELWADLRYRGLSTASDERLDGDVILAAQALISDAGRNEFVVATRNSGHLGRMVPAKNWWEIS
jgi:hypothetical protein